jgi:hypothetical protein
MVDKARATLPGTVEKVVKPVIVGDPEKAEIAVEGADDEHKKITIENTLVDKSGHEVHLNPGAKVEVTIKAEPEAIRFGR